MALDKSDVPAYEFGNFRLIPEERLLLRAGEPVALPPKVFDALSVLVANAGHLIEKNELLDRLWTDSFVEESTLARTISSIRKALGEQDETKYIETVAKRGYRFVAPVRHLSGEKIPSDVSQSPASGERAKQTANVASQEKIETVISPAAPRKRFVFRRGWLFFLLIAAFAAVIVLLIAFDWQPKPSREINSVAVLPFVNQSGNDDLEYLSDGMTETLISRLSQLPNLKVKAYSSVFRYKGKETDALSIGQELNVQAVLTGRVVQRGDDLTLYLSLEEVETGNRIWGNQYNRKITNLIALQTEIARDVFDRLKSKLSGAEEKTLAKNETENAEAYQLYLRGRYHWNKRTTKDLQKAVQYFERAITADQNYALAYAGLAETYAVLNHYLSSADQFAFPKAREAAQKALSIDDSLAEAHAVLAVVKYNYDWNWSEAELEFKRALALNPNDATAHLWFAECLYYQGRFDEGVAHIERARELDPVSPIINAQSGAVYMWQGQCDRAVEQYRKTLELDPTFIVALYGLGICLEREGKYDEAIASYQKTTSLSRLAWMGYAYAVSGRRREARAILGQLEKMHREQQFSPYLLAIVHAGLGEKEETLKYLETAYENRDGRLAMVKIDVHFDRFRAEPRFQNLLRRIGF